MIEIKNFINGQFVDAKSGKTLENYEPATGAVYSTCPDSEALDVVLAIQSAQKAFDGWSKTPRAERARVLNRIADLVEKNTQRLAEAESRDVGKPLWLSKDIEIPRVVTNFRFFAAKILTEDTVSSDMDGKAINYMLRQPIGVCGLISPWNLPLYLLTWKLAPCLAMGNTAVAKPSELSPMTAFLLGEILNEAGLPPGVCNIVFGRGETAGDALVSHPGVPLISFTGGTATGLKVQMSAAPQFKKLSLELGGKNANIILKDADLKKAVPTTLRSSFQNSGQICLCGSRILVQQDIYNEFMSEFRKQAQDIKMGDPFEPGVFMGPVVSKEHKQKILSAIELAKKENGKVTVNGSDAHLPEKNKNGYFVGPTIIEDLTNCSELWQNEIFGPVVTVMPFKYPADAVKWANTSSYGLSASLWTADVGRAHRMAAQIEAGTVWVNTWMRRDLRAPFGGVKHSGIGREGGDFSLDFYSETKNICIDIES
jgi:aminomuconate-semialdehyde/2-hydroxymuconate-6-semialdehyde dehydrogenase